MEGAKTLPQKIPAPLTKATHIVKPAEPTPNHAMPLPNCDQIKALTHAPTLYFYSPTTTTLSQATLILTQALSKTLVPFYPLAGRLHWATDTSDQSGRVELHCNGEGALLIEAESEATLEHYRSSHFIPTPEVSAHLIPSFDLSTTPLHQIPRCACQVTKFKCGGICIGMGLCHIAGDGRSCLHFMAEWSKTAACRVGEQQQPPFLDRRVLLDVETSLAEPIFNHPELDPPPLLLGTSDNLQERNKPTTVTMFKITKEEIEKLKNLANADYHINGEMKKHGHGYSRYETLSAHIWRTACKARGLLPEQPTRFNITADIRRRVHPPLPENYFGNTVIRIAAAANAGELVENPLGYGARRLREALEKLTDKYIRSYLLSTKKIKDLSRYRYSHSVGCSKSGFYGNPNMEGTSWVGLRTYGADFGWGEEVHMGPGAVGMDGKFIVVPTRDGDGSFNVFIRLQVEHMDAFQKFLYEDL